MIIKMIKDQTRTVGEYFSNINDWWLQKPKKS